MRDAANLNANANMWRMVNDFWDTNALSNLTGAFNAAGTWQAQTGAHAGPLARRRHAAARLPRAAARGGRAATA